MEGRQLHAPPPKGQAHIQQFPRHAVGCRRTEHQGQQQINRRGCYQQHSCVDIRVKNAVYRRNGPAGEESYPQHASCHGAGNGEQQHRQAKEPLFSPKGHKGKEYPRRRLHRCLGKKPSAGEEAGHGIHPAKQRGDQIPSPSQGDPGQPGRSQKEQIIHQSIEGKHTVRIYHRHPSLPPSGVIIGYPSRKIRRKKRTGASKSETPVL